MICVTAANSLVCWGCFCGENLPLSGFSTPGKCQLKVPKCFGVRKTPAVTPRLSFEDGMQQNLGPWGLVFLPDWLVLGIQVKSQHENVVQVERRMLSIEDHNGPISQMCIWVMQVQQVGFTCIGYILNRKDLISKLG